MNTVVGWIVLLFLIVVGFCVVAGVAAAIDNTGQPSSVTCSGYGYAVTCVRS